LVSKQTTVPIITKLLTQLKATEIKVVEMAQGQIISRFIAWTFLTPTQQKDWIDKRWK
jgi:23S rRNA (adenine1618-N6)-methyltransferase